jgi:hypothetical protein
LTIHDGHRSPAVRFGWRPVVTVTEARGLSARSFVVYGGTRAQNRTGARVVPWNRIASVR